MNQEKTIYRFLVNFDEWVASEWKSVDADSHESAAHHAATVYDEAAGDYPILGGIDKIIAVRRETEEAARKFKVRGETVAVYHVDEV
jgi:hypothetical protein